MHNGLKNSFIHNSYSMPDFDVFKGFCCTRIILLNYAKSSDKHFSFVASCGNLTLSQPGDLLNLKGWDEIGV